MKIRRYGISADSARRLPVRGQSNGFTLLEVLVAIAVLAVALAGIMEIFSMNAKNITKSEDYVKASVVAESVMRKVLEDDELEEGSWDDVTEDGYEISVTVNGIEEERTENLSVMLLEVNLKLQWERGAKVRALSLKTVKMLEKRI